MTPAPGTWRPTLGSWPTAEGIAFRVWAPTARTVEVCAEGSTSARVPFPLQRQEDGTFIGTSLALAVGDRYRYRVNGQGPYPDPASRYQPEGVHGPSEIIDPSSFRWSDEHWRGVNHDDLVIYELHVGTFTSAGTFAAARERLPALRDLGITAVELMPLADFPGQRNWGYDGVCPFAPARCYGRPDELRQFIDTAHGLGLAVLLDAVYNHLGPDGNYLHAFSPFYFNEAHHTPWGAALNYDGEYSTHVRAYFRENALYWLHEYHFDGLRLDATHAIMDDSDPHFLAELSDTIHATIPERRTVLIAEDDRNLARLPQPTARNGFGLDAVWSDDFHHQLRRGLAGDCESYYRDYTGTVADLATTLRQGWFYTGQLTPTKRRQRGTDPSGLSPRHFVICLQNHDQVGNRAFGERLHHQIDLSAYRAASALLLTAAQPPLLFMGQEWAASTPFLFFTDHDPKLGQLVTEGRRKEFQAFSQFADPAIREQIPDPQAEATFRASVLDWSEGERSPHQKVRQLYQDLLQLRRTELSGTHQEVTTSGDGTILLRRENEAGATLLVVVALKPEQEVTLPAGPWQVILTTEDAPYTDHPRPVELDLRAEPLRIFFPGPAAVLLRQLPATC